MRVLLMAILLLFAWIQPGMAQTVDRLSTRNPRLIVDTASVVTGRVTRGPGSIDREMIHARRVVHQSADSRKPSGDPGWITRHPALFGALLGAGAGAVTGYALGQDCSHNTGTGSCSSRAGATAVGAGLGAAGGAMVGFLVGRK